VSLRCGSGFEPQCARTGLRRSVIKESQSVIASSLLMLAGDANVNDHKHGNGVKP
jgi:hypothetical protein